MKNLYFCIALLTTGCAAMFDGSTQDFTAIPTNAENHTLCSATNEEGSWQNMMPMQAYNIEKDGNTMVVTCDNDKQHGVTNIEPRFQGAYLVLDIILDACIISCWVDGLTNSFYSYPSSATIYMLPKK